KAERRHELKENALAKQAVRAVKVMQMPDWRRKYASRAALVLAAIVLVAALVLHRINSSREEQQPAIDHLARARFPIEQQHRSAPRRSARPDFGSSMTSSTARSRASPSRPAATWSRLASSSPTPSPSPKPPSCAAISFTPSPPSRSHPRPPRRPPPRPSPPRR